MRLATVLLTTKPKITGTRRIFWIGVFQVMHHGAEGNWHQGVAKSISPIFSVFSSDPERRRWKHPHASVLRDFWAYRAVQIDKVSGFSIDGFVAD
jgi:beta-lactamase superfamily II metal-dependent hydrolase